MADEDVIEAAATEEHDQLPAVAHNLPALRASEAMIAQGEITVAQLVAQADKIKQVMAAAMKEGVHFGKIPGVNKPTLLKPGAEMLNVLLRLAPSYQSERTFHDDGHLTVVSKCTLTHIPTGYVIAEGEGLCTSRESKYAYRQGKRRCPDCGAEAIVRSTRKKAYFCISAEGGCGSRFAFGTDRAVSLDGEDAARVDNPDLPDTFNTVLKMADKRSLVAAVLNGTAASDVFTQDVEDERGAPQPVDDPFTTAEARPFDPAIDLWRGAITGDDALERIGEALTAIDPTMDWRDLLKQIPDERDKRFWRRLANTIAKLQEEMGGDFPPPETAVIQEAFAWGFNGQLVEPHYIAEEESAPLGSEPLPEPDESISFEGGAYKDE